MKMFDINGDMVTADVRPSKYPVRVKSRSKLQQKTGEFLQEKYPFYVILEDYFIPSSQLSVDFFIPNIKLVVEVQSNLHDTHVPMFHGDQKTSKGYAGQIKRDSRKAWWAEANGYRMVEIRNEKDLGNI